MRRITLILLLIAVAGCETDEGCPDDGDHIMHNGECVTSLSQWPESEFCSTTAFSEAEAEGCEHPMPHYCHATCHTVPGHLDPLDDAALEECAGSSTVPPTYEGCLLYHCCFAP